MNAITTAAVVKAVFATALVAVCNVSLAAQPAAIKSMQARPSVAVTAEAVAVDPVAAIRDAGRQAQRQIIRDAMQQSLQQLNAMPVLVPVTDELVADLDNSGRQFAVKE